MTNEVPLQDKKRLEHAVALVVAHVAPHSTLSEEFWELLSGTWLHIKLCFTLSGHRELDQATHWHLTRGATNAAICRDHPNL